MDAILQAVFVGAVLLLAAAPGASAATPFDGTCRAGASSAGGANGQCPPEIALSGRFADGKMTVGTTGERCNCTWSLSR